MSKVSDIVAKVLSVVFYPLFIPTYGMGLFCYAYSRQSVLLPPIWMAVAIVGTFLLTCAIPLSAIWIMIRKGDIKDIQIEDMNDRTVPYIYTLFGFACWCYFLFSIVHAPLSISLVSGGATAAIGLVALINRWWKISAHLTGIGGLVGGVMAYCLGIGTMPTWTVMAILFGVSILMMWARLKLNAHTDMQVSAGWLLGLACTFIPYFIMTYVQ